MKTKILVILLAAKESCCSRDMGSSMFSRVIVQEYSYERV